MTTATISPAQEAAAIVAKYVKILGLGFHPDTKGRDYVEVKSGKRTFTAPEAKQYDADIDRLFDIADDPYAVGIAEWEKQGLT